MFVKKWAYGLCISRIVGCVFPDLEPFLGFFNGGFFDEEAGG